MYKQSLLKALSNSKFTFIIESNEKAKEELEKYYDLNLLQEAFPNASWCAINYYLTKKNKRFMIYLNKLKRKGGK